MLVKIWDAKVKNLISVEVPDDSDLIIFGMAMHWANAPKEWCEENCKGRYVFGHFIVNGAAVFFQHDYDAMAFKLRWL